jgi:hypothetical protein
MFRRIENLYNKKIDATGLAVFRILYSIVLALEIIDLIYFRQLIFDKIPFIEPNEIDFTIPLYLWLIVSLFLIVGIFKKTTTLTNYIFTLVFLATIKSYEYHMFYVYSGINFLLIFLPVNRVLSLDSLLRKLKYYNLQNKNLVESKVSVLYYYIPIVLGIGFVYFDSIFYKVTSHLWMNGLGMWLPASLPQVSQYDTTWLLNQKWIVLSLGYLTLFFEAIFLFTFFRKKWRLPLLIIGLGLHIGILIKFPIPWFALGVSTIYLLLIPVSFYKKLKELFKFKNNKVDVFYNANCQATGRVILILNHFDILGIIKFNKLNHGDNISEFIEDKSSKFSRIEIISKKKKAYRGLDAYNYLSLYSIVLWPLYVLFKIPFIKTYAYKKYNSWEANNKIDKKDLSHPSIELSSNIYKLHCIEKIKILTIQTALLLLLFLQINVTFNSTFINKIKENLDMNQHDLIKRTDKISKKIATYSRIFLGITPHAVFMDSHFDGYNHIIALEATDSAGNNFWLPIVDELGKPDKYAQGFNWVKWTFRVNSPKINKIQLEKGIRDFSAFWAFKNGVDLNNLFIQIHVKKVLIPKTWEKNFLRTQYKSQWLDGGYVKWCDKNFISCIKNIEEI